ncbi:phosphoglucomutase/phosphomannomutase, alpha/beta/alpha domain II [Ancylostoma ceylanicum]|uniref:Phosphoglucomutase/phosphomannomutase, alpha/beta/alpha domain II n=1 Tax=Ancylostoma ceylanicum TaxID=53326 RepID=A0A0D6LSB1_9BILA|nr:phosphoglucomutase/phosphomannomutase, alpha/beta/alpha domain II [Ancylostoma ceylanicum]
MKPRDEYWDIDSLAVNSLLHTADTTIDPYFELERQSLNFHRSINEKSPLKITYSAFHGVGYLYAKRMIKEFGFPVDHFISVKEQQDPDPDFPTVPFPNPEEGHKVSIGLLNCFEPFQRLCKVGFQVLTLSFKTADANGSNFIIANDPDADRIQIAEKQPKLANPKANKQDVYIINSAVSSQIVKTIAEAEGIRSSISFKSDVTLTGFKWLGNKADELRSKGKTVILAWEESIGYMPGHALDKLTFDLKYKLDKVSRDQLRECCVDGINCAGMYAEMAAWLQSQGKTVQQQLFDLYHKYGFHLVRSSYWFTPSPAVTKELFGSLRKDLKVYFVFVLLS